MAQAGKKMQDFKFESYVELFDSLPANEQLIVQTLKEIIEDTIPDVKFKLSWNIPAFYKKRSICYIWPGSVAWGEMTSEGVQFGFSHANKMTPNKYLNKGNRKQVYYKTFNTIEEVERDLDILVSLLQEANEIDGL